MLQSKVRKFDFTPIRYYSHLSAYILSVGRNVQCPPTQISVARTGSGTKRPAPPTLFPDTDNFKALQPKALRPDELGAPKRKRDNYGAFAKRNRKTVRT
ncbi:hypothetical protein DPMN_009761 [Dreissena polymorpha]|uniref:Uncharacterized protein n=1 Tax=Dreissena polymorpha TaxID=45954 RepID=A0A9D4S0E8_DREPO|nr:hypothetical protein DPMN_009761 [Dreissena polymorpha]